MAVCLENDRKKRKWPQRPSKMIQSLSSDAPLFLQRGQHTGGLKSQTSASEYIAVAKLFIFAECLPIIHTAIIILSPY